MKSVYGSDFDIFKAALFICHEWLFQFSLVWNLGDILEGLNMSVEPSGSNTLEEAWLDQILASDQASMPAEVIQNFDPNVAAEDIQSNVVPEEVEVPETPTEEIKEEAPMRYRLYEVILQPREQIQAMANVPLPPIPMRPSSNVVNLASIEDDLPRLDLDENLEHDLAIVAEPKTLDRKKRPRRNIKRNFDEIFADDSQNHGEFSNMITEQESNLLEGTLASNLSSSQMQDITNEAQAVGFNTNMQFPMALPESSDAQHSFGEISSTDQKPCIGSKKPRTIFSDSQCSHMRAVFNDSPYIDKEKRAKLACRLNISEETIAVSVTRHLPNCWPTIPRPNKWTLYSNMVCVGRYVRPKQNALQR